MLCVRSVVDERYHVSPQKLLGKCEKAFKDTENIIMQYRKVKNKWKN